MAKKLISISSGSVVEVADEAVLSDDFVAFTSLDALSTEQKIALGLETASGSPGGRTKADVKSKVEPEDERV